MAYLAHLILNVSNFERSATFYDSIAQVLGLKTRIVHKDKDYKIKAYNIPGCPIYIRWKKEEEKNPFVRNVGLDHLCIGVESRILVDQAHKAVEGFGLLITSAPKVYPEYTPRYYAFYFRDPDGIPLEIVCMA